MAIYRCMDVFLDTAQIVAISDLETTAVHRRFVVYIGNNAQNLVFKGLQGGEGWVRVANHHKWLMQAWDGYQRDMRTWSWGSTIRDVPLMVTLRNFHISLFGITAVGPVEDLKFPIYLYGRVDPLMVAGKETDRLQADHDGLVAAWKQVIRPIVADFGHPDSVQTF